MILPIFIFSCLTCSGKILHEPTAGHPADSHLAVMDKAGKQCCWPSPAMKEGQLGCLCGFFTALINFSSLDDMRYLWIRGKDGKCLLTFLKPPSLKYGIRKHRTNPSLEGNLLLKPPQPEKGVCLDKTYSYVLEDSSRVEPCHTPSKKLTNKQLRSQIASSLLLFPFKNTAAHR